VQQVRNFNTSLKNTLHSTLQHTHRPVARSSYQQRPLSAQWGRRVAHPNIRIRMVTLHHLPTPRSLINMAAPEYCFGLAVTAGILVSQSYPALILVRPALKIAAQIATWRRALGSCYWYVNLFYAVMQF
jgi:hypothetical protein